MAKHEKTDEELRADWDAATTKGAKLRVLAAVFVSDDAGETYDQWERRQAEAWASIFTLAADQYERDEASPLAKAVWKSAKAMIKDDGE